MGVRLGGIRVAEKTVDYTNAGEATYDGGVFRTMTIHMTLPNSADEQRTNILPI